MIEDEKYSRLYSSETNDIEIYLTKLFINIFTKQYLYL